MSLILEALRKMEQDRKSRRGAAPDMRPQVLRYRATGKPQEAKPYLLVAVGVVLITGGIGAGILLKGNGKVVLSQQGELTGSTAPAALTAPLVPAAPTEQLAPAPVAAPIALPAAAQTAAPAVVRPAPMAVPSAPVRAVTGGQPPPASVELPGSRPARKTAAAGRAARMEAADTPQGTPSGPEATGDSQATIPDITISGIAYQDERKLRRAVLNGSLVGEGAEVAGARVVEIRENKVRMSRGGQHFDVVFSSGVQSR